MNLKNIIKNYAKFIEGISPEIIDKVSEGESCDLIRGAIYKNCQIDFLDLSTNSITGTFKDWVACIVVSYCLQNGITEFVTQSSGNTANSLAYYAEKNGIQLTIFYPALSRYKIHDWISNANNINLIEIDGSETNVKAITELYSTIHNVVWLPTYFHQIQANKLRAYCLSTFYKKYKIEPHNWHSQALSSAYGIFGFHYGMLELNDYEVPKICGVQQEAVSPFFNFYNSISENKYYVPIVEPTLFRTKPTSEILRELSSIITTTNGELVLIKNVEYYYWYNYVIDIWSNAGVFINQRFPSNPFMYDGEKAGIYATIGILKLIENGIIGSHETSLVALTGGYKKYASGSFIPKHIIKCANLGLDDLNDQLTMIK